MHDSLAAPAPAHDRSPCQSDILDLLSWALASGARPREWWAAQLGLDEQQLDALLEGENDRLLRARMRRAVADASDGHDVSRAVRSRVIEIAAGRPKATTLAQVSLALRRLPPWIVAEWGGVSALALPAVLADAPRAEQHKAQTPGFAPDDPRACLPEPWASMDPEELRATVAEAREFLKEFDEQYGPIDWSREADDFRRQKAL